MISASKGVMLCEAIENTQSLLLISKLVGIFCPLPTPSPDQLWLSLDHRSTIGSAPAYA